jgi:hypothetical protein
MKRRVLEWSIQNKESDVYWHIVLQLRDVSRTYVYGLVYQHQLLVGMLRSGDWRWYTEPIYDIGARGKLYVVQYVYPDGTKRREGVDDIVMSHAMYYGHYEVVVKQQTERKNE